MQPPRLTPAEYAKYLDKAIVPPPSTKAVILTDDQGQRVNIQESQLTHISTNQIGNCLWLKLRDGRMIHLVYHTTAAMMAQRNNMIEWFGK